MKNILVVVISLLLGLGATFCDNGDRKLPGEGPIDGGLEHPADADADGAEDTGGDAGGDSDLPDTGLVCDEMDLPVTRVTPRVLIVLDRSNSMGHDGYWDPVREAVYSVTNALETRIAFGLMVFPRTDGRQACAGSENPCEPARSPTLSCNANYASRIRGALRDLRTCGGTPTAMTLDAAAEYFREIPSFDHVPRPRDSLGHVLLATDGAPNCNEDLPPSTCRCTGSRDACEDHAGNCLDDERTLQAISDLRDVEVDLYVLGIAVSEWVDVLDEMALQGGTEAAYMVDEPLEIEEELDSITEGLTTCEVVVRPPEPVADPNKVNFYVEGVRVPRDSEGDCDEGWTWMDDQHEHVVFCGSWCERLRSGEVDDVIATFGCPTLI